MLDWLVLCQPWPYSNPSITDQRDYAMGSRAEFVACETSPHLCIVSCITVVCYLRAVLLSLLTIIWTQSSLRCWCTVWPQKSLFSVLHPSLAAGKAVHDSTVHSKGKGLWAHQVSLLLYVHRFDAKLMKQAISANLCSFSTYKVQCIQCTALRAGMIKKASLLQPVLANKPLFSVPVQSLFHLVVHDDACAYGCVYMSSCWLEGGEKGACQNKHAASTLTFRSITLC